MSTGWRDHGLALSCLGHSAGERDAMPSSESLAADIVTPALAEPRGLTSTCIFRFSHTSCDRSVGA